MRYFNILILLFSQIYAWEVDISDNILFEQNDGGTFYPDQTNYINGELTVNFKTRKFEFLLRDYAFIGIPEDTTSADLYSSSNSQNPELFIRYYTDSFSVKGFLNYCDMNIAKRSRTSAGGVLEFDPANSFKFKILDEWLKQDVSEMDFLDTQSSFNQISPEIQYSLINKNSYVYTRFDYQRYSLNNVGYASGGDYLLPAENEDLTRLRIGMLYQSAYSSKIELYAENGDLVNSNDNRLWGGIVCTLFPDILPSTPLRPLLESNVISTVKKTPVASRTQFGILTYFRKPTTENSGIFLKPFAGYVSHFNSAKWERKWIGMQVFLGLHSRLFLDIKEKHYFYNNDDALDRIIISSNYRFYKYLSFSGAYNFYDFLKNSESYKRGQLQIGISQNMNTKDIFGIENIE